MADLASFTSNPPIGYNGVSVRGGQCGELVRQYWIDVDHTNPPSYMDSKDYWTNPVPGYDKVATPQPGDIAIYDGHGAFPEGHSAIYVDGRVFEQNADPDGSPAHLFNRANTYLLGYLHKQGGSDVINTPDDAAEFIRWGFKREPTDNEVKDLIGRSWHDACVLYRTSTAGVQVSAEVNNYATLETELANATKGFVLYAGTPLYTKKG